MSENEQIRKIKQILEELGMVGRPSLTKCEEIREKLEFEKEMQAIDSSNILTTSRRRADGSSQPTSLYSNALPSQSSDDDDRLDLSKLGDPEDSS